MLCECRFRTAQNTWAEASWGTVRYDAGTRPSTFSGRIPASSRWNNR